MEWKRILQTPFVLAPLTGLILGNYSLGAIIAGLTVLIWGMGSGMNFISLTTIVLVMLTGNISSEIIFIFVISLAFLLREEKLFPFLDQKIKYTVFAFFTVSLYPLWRYFLGSIPASLLNEISIAGQVLLITGILLTVLRGKLLIESGIRISELAGFILFFLTAISGLTGSYYLIPIWITGNFLLYIIKNKKLFYNLSTTHYKVILYLSGSIAGYLLLPIGFFLSLALVTLFSFLWNREKLPVLEMVYFSVIIGILAGRLGLLV
jgi:hypothetical protein